MSKSMPFLGASLGSSPSSKGKSPPGGGFLLPSRSQREASARTKPKAQPHARRRGAGGMDVEEAPTWREIADSAAAPRRSIQRVPPILPPAPATPACPLHLSSASLAHPGWRPASRRCPSPGAGRVPSLLRSLLPAGPPVWWDPWSPAPDPALLWPAWLLLI